MGEPLKIDLSFEDALKHVLSVGPMPRDEKPTVTKRRRRTASKPTKKR